MNNRHPTGPDPRNVLLLACGYSAVTLCVACMPIGRWWSMLLCLLAMSVMLGAIIYYGRAHG